MSSTNKTQKIQLNQWAALDPVLREDFNSDNAKIDAAFQSVDTDFSSTNSSISALGASILALPYVKIKEYAFSFASVKQIDLALGVNLWDYSRVNIRGALHTTGYSASGLAGAYLLLNGMTGVYGTPTTSGSSNISEGLTFLYVAGSSTVGHMLNIDLFISKAGSFPKGLITSNYSSLIITNSGAAARNEPASSYGLYATDFDDSINTINFKVANESHSLTSGNFAVYGIKA